MTNCPCNTVKIGQAVRFVPHFLEVAKTASKEAKETEPDVIGKVYKVNRNGVIHVEFPIGGVTMRESFTAFDFGRKVRTVK